MIAGDIASSASALTTEGFQEGNGSPAEKGLQSTLEINHLPSLTYDLFRFL